MSLTLTLHSISGLKGHGDRVAKITFRGRIYSFIFFYHYLSKNYHIRQDYCKIAVLKHFLAKSLNGLSPQMSRTAMSSKYVFTTVLFLVETKSSAGSSWSSKKSSKSDFSKFRKHYWTTTIARCKRKLGTSFSFIIY